MDKLMILGEEYSVLLYTSEGLFSNRHFYVVQVTVKVMALWSTQQKRQLYRQRTC